MTIIVPRHEFPTSAAEDRARLLDKSVRRRIDSLEQHPENINLAFGTSVLAAHTHCGHDARAALLPTWEAWVTAMQLGSALFASATTTAGSVECRIADQVQDLPAAGPQPYADAGNWLTAFWLAIVCRERGRLTQLANVPISLLGTSGAAYDDYVYPWVETLQKWWREGGELGDLLVAAMRGTDPAALRVAEKDLVLKIEYPPINLFAHYVTQDAEKFNEALADALNWHKSYWTEDEERRGSSTGLVALGPLAITCLAYDADLPIEVESEYLPKHLIERGWIGEFPT
ncbi:immunity 49 family protein [Streptomyces sp. NPDC059037]|uniref:immunity 49 family protein n=1 Tax=Streptomyces sp. NPDC059037 TaxID=3346710 RepID=UPI0036972C18